MEFKGSTTEVIELKMLESSNESILSDHGASDLTILWFESDNNEFNIDGKNYVFGKNQIVFFTEFHKIIVKKRGEAKYLRFNRSFYCVIDNDVEVSCKGLLFFGASQLPIITIPDEDINHFEILWKMFSIEMQLKDNLQISMLQMMLKRYLILCTRLFKVQHQFPKEEKSSDLIREFNYLVETHFKTKYSVMEYADILNKSPKTISNVFAKISTKSPLQYIQNRRMLEARRLLKYSSLQIQEIAYDIGFDDIQAFSRFFKKQEGVSPSDYKNNLSRKVKSSLVISL
jgi:AraC-like DNA-binding protein